MTCDRCRKESNVIEWGYSEILPNKRFCRDCWYELYYILMLNRLMNE